MSYLEGLAIADVAGTTPIRRTLENGAEVVVVERPGCGLMSAQVWIRTGSLHEGDCLGAGLSHYLEHMVFKGSARFTGRQLTERVQSIGGSSNAYTTFDRTVYYIDGPEDGLENALETLSDMLLDPQLKDADAKTEREVILREIDMCADDHDGILAEAALAEAFRSHPMRHPVIGHHELFSAVTPDQLRAYHAARYTTDNIVISIASSCPSETVVGLVERWFGRFTRRSTEVRLVTAEPSPAVSRSRVLQRDVSTARGVVLWRTPGILSPESLSLDLIAGILGAGQSSLLWKELRERRKLVHAISASSWGIEDAGMIWIGWSGDAGTDHAQVEAAIQGVIDDFLREGVTEEALAKVRRQAVVGMVNAIKSVHGVASRAGYALAIARDESQALANAQKLAALKAEDLTQTARAVLRPTMRTSVAMLPKAKKEETPLVVKAVEAPVAFEVRTLPNGIRIVLQQDRSIPKVGVGIFMAGGAAYENPARRGETSLLATMLARDTAKRTQASVAETVDRLGMTFREHASQLSLGLWGEALSADFDTVAELVADGVFTPKIDPVVVLTERAALADACRESLDEVLELARLKLLKTFFGDHPLSVPASGLVETVEAIQPADLVALHSRLIRPTNLVVGICGDFDRKAIESFIEKRLAAIPSSPFDAQVLPQPIAKPTTTHTEQVDREQAVVLLGYPHCGFGSERIAAANLAEELLSGMASGLFHRIREEKGLAYFVGASRVESRDHGLFYLYAGTHAGAAETVAAEMRAELERLASGKFNDGEIAMAKLRLRVARRQGRQAASARMQGAMLREVAGLGANYDEVWEARLNATGDNDVAAFVRDYLQPKFEQSVTLLPKA